MPPKLIQDGIIRILGQTTNSVVYMITNEDRHEQSVLKGGTVWYKGREALGPNKGMDESDERARKEASIYETLGKYDRILNYFGLEVANIGDGGIPKAWAIRLEWAPYGCLRDLIRDNEVEALNMDIRLDLAVQFVEGVVHIHDRGVIWGDLSTRNALLFDGWRLKLGDFADLDLADDYPNDWYGCEIRYCPPGSDRPLDHTPDTSTMSRELFALGIAIFEMTEWKIPYGSETEVFEDDVITALANGEWPQLTDGNPAESIIRRCWEFKYKSSHEVFRDLQCLEKTDRSLVN